MRIMRNEILVLSYPGPAHRRIPEGTRPDRGALDRHPQDLESHGSGCLVRLPVHKLAQWTIDQFGTPEVERLIKLLIGEWPRLELRQAPGLKDDDHFRMAYLLPAMQAGLVQMKFPDKPRITA